MNAVKINLQKVAAWLRALGNQARVALSTIKERGAKHFSRCFILGAIAVFACYSLLYVPTRSKLALLEKETERARAKVGYVDQYEDLYGRLSRLYSFLPDSTKRNAWLINTLIQSMKAEGVSSEAIPMPMEEEKADLVFQKVSVPATLKFSQLVPWLDRLNSTKPMIHVFSLSLEKKEDRPGDNKIIFGISTIIPMRELER
ncbi:MAG: hypothetical protein A3J74_11445 [Elusimicrobia bacterium RIFCSPHIGHO2_02_FULL_57_9]|nr:MAG: hypothetical protein A3J74_11445 [Elusimicrobia bacterium RIFCSPHIGHO2_02_FULL_57_9]